MARALFALALLAGCDVVFIAEHEFRVDAAPDAPPDAGRNCIRDSFETLANWMISPPGTAPNAHIENAMLVLPFRGDFGGRSEVAFNRFVNFTDAHASVRVVVPPPDAFLRYSYFGVALNQDNFQLFRLTWNGTNLIIEFFVRKNATETTMGELAFDQSLRHWRFSHVPATNMIEMQTSDTGEEDKWTTRFAVPPIADVAHLTFVLGAFDGTVNPPATPAAFDDFSVCTF